MTPHASTRPVTQRLVIRSEWIKLRTVRSSWFVLGATVISIVGLGLLVSYVNNQQWDGLDAAARADIDPLNQSLIGVNLAQLVLGVLGVLTATSEYATGMIRATFAAVPRRLPVLPAKAVVLAAVTVVVALIAVLIAVLGGQALFGGHGITVSTADTVRAVLGATGYLTLVGVIGIGLGFLTRSTAGGITVLLGVLLVLPILVAPLPGNQTFGPYLPSTAGRAVFLMNGGDDLLAPGTGFGLFLLYAALVLAAAAVAVRRRDA